MGYTTRHKSVRSRRSTPISPCHSHDPGCVIPFLTIQFHSQGSIQWYENRYKCTIASSLKIWSQRDPSTPCSPWMRLSRRKGLVSSKVQSDGLDYNKSWPTFGQVLLLTRSNRLSAHRDSSDRACHSSQSIECGFLGTSEIRGGKIKM